MVVAPNNDLARNNLANEMSVRGMNDEAIKLYRQILARNPNFWLANFNLGYAEFKLGHYEEARLYLTRATTLNSIDAEQYFYLGLTEMNLGRLDLAELALRQAIANEPRALGYHYWLGKVLQQRGRFGDAAEYFQAELAKNPQDAAARAELDALQQRSRP